MTSADDCVHWGTASRNESKGSSGRGAQKRNSDNVMWLTCKKLANANAESRAAVAVLILALAALLGPPKIHDDRIERLADDVIRVPSASQFLQPLISIGFLSSAKEFFKSVRRVIAAVLIRFSSTWS